MKPQLVVVVSDIHCGSDVGLAPPEVKTDAGNVIGFGDNIHQEWLWAAWVDGIARVRQILGKSKAVLVVNGDCVEGVHHRNEAELVIAQKRAHVRMAVECLKPLAKLSSSSLVVKGTQCHVEDMEDTIAEELGSISGKAKDKWLFTVHGCLIDAAHHMGVTSRAYLEASGMSIAMGNAIVNYARSGHEIPRIFLRGHRHCGGHYTDGRNLFVVTGAWQFLTRHAFKVVTDAIPRPSIIVLDWRDKPAGALPTVHEIGFNQPQSEITEF